MTILEQLNQDHTNIRRLLSILDRKVTKLRGGEHPNFGLLAEAVDYLINYADEYHHPWEQDVFLHFASRDEELDKVMAQCSAQHAELRGSGCELSKSLDCILHDAVIPMDKFTDSLEQYVQLQSQHLELEDSKLAPRLLSVATTVDWQTLERALSRPDDPLFGETQSEQYSMLYQQLLLGSGD